ncbi:MAG: hypothetical protein ACOC5J_02145, partial [Gemmatimonadota bacterium]
PLRRTFPLQDLDALTERFLRFDRSFSPGRRVLFAERIGELPVHTSGAEYAAGRDVALEAVLRELR